MWSNWAGTHRCAPARTVTPSNAAGVATALADAARAGDQVRVVGSGHSFSPLVLTDGVQIDVASLRGIASVDAARNRVSIGAGTRICDIGPDLWEHGLSLANQGGIDSQTIAGAVSTATHGSGLGYTSLSSVVTSAQLVTAAGEVVQIDEDDARLDSVRTSLGALGVLTELELQVVPRYELTERVDYWPLGEVLERWREENAVRRHLSFWYGPAFDCELEQGGPPADMADPCLVRRYFEDDDEARHVDTRTPALLRRDRGYLIYPDTYTTPWDEMEYFVPYEATLDAIAALVPVFERYPDQFPLEVRTVRSESSVLAAAHGRDSTSLGLCRSLGSDYWPFFHEVDTVLREFDARPHWGKTHFFDAERIRTSYPRYDEFEATRRELDPDGIFLNDHLRQLTTGTHQPRAVQR